MDLGVVGDPEAPEAVDKALERLQTATDRRKQRRLPGAVVSDDPEALPGLEAKREPLEDHYGIAVPHRDVLEAHEGAAVPGGSAAASSSRTSGSTAWPRTDGLADSWQPAMSRLSLKRPPFSLLSAPQRSSSFFWRVLTTDWRLSSWGSQLPRLLPVCPALGQRFSLIFFSETLSAMSATLRSIAVFLRSSAASSRAAAAPAESAILA